MIKPEYIFNKIVEYLILAGSLLIYFIGIVGGTGIVIYQVFNYLKSGIWGSVSLIHVVGIFNEELRGWVASPADWLGVHKLLSFIPLSLSMVLVGIFLGMYLFNLYKKFSADNEFIFNS